jgi:integrase
MASAEIELLYGGGSGRGKKLPEVLTELELTRLLRQANRRSASGARNLAMLLCMCRYALPAPLCAPTSV